MHFIIHCLDKPGGPALRLANYEAHKAYLSSYPKTALSMVISGPLLGPDNETMIGSLFLVEAEHQDRVMDFHRNDPFFAAGVWDKVEIHPFLKRVDNR